MGLLDHFHPPLEGRRHWHSFHHAWATYITEALNRFLPERYFAEASVQFGLEIDVATFDESNVPMQHQGDDWLPAPLTAWMPVAPTQTIPFALATDQVEVNVFYSAGGPMLVGAIELISPANKDRPAQREAFVSKCEAYLQQGIGLVIVDVVTIRRANLHNNLLARLNLSSATDMEASLYATAYHVVAYGKQTNLDVWQEPLSIGNALPTMPLWLRGGPCVPIVLHETYERTCREQRIPPNGA